MATMGERADFRLRVAVSRFHNRLDSKAGGTDPTHEGLQRMDVFDGA